MSTNYHHRPWSWDLFILSAVLLMSVGGRQSTLAQGPLPGAGGISRITSAPNPRVLKHIGPKRLAERSGKTDVNVPKLSSEVEKQQAIEEAIKVGNQARDDKDYQLALASYRKVTEDLKSQDARAFYGMGNVYADLYCSDSALEAYFEAVTIQPTYLEALVGLGYAYISKERYDDAWKQFEAAAPKSVDARIGLGVVYGKKREYPEAIEQINLVINDKSVEAKDRAAACVALGDVYWKQEKWPETIAQYEKAISLNSKLATAYVSLGSAQLTSAFGKFTSIKRADLKGQDRAELTASAKQAESNIQKAMGELKYNNPNGYIFLGFALVHQAHYQEAIGTINLYLGRIKELEDRVSKMTTKCDYGFKKLNADGYWLWGFAYSEEALLETNKQKRTELLNQAIEKMREVIKLKEDSASAYSELALVYFEQGKYEDAIEQDKKAILYATDDLTRAVSYRSIGLSFLKMGRYDEAVENLQDALRRKPNDALSHEVLASTYEGIASKSVGQGNMEETLKWLKKADEIRTAPSTNPDPYYFLGATYAIRFMQKRKATDFEEAVKWLKKAIEIKASYANAYAALGTVYYKNLNAEDALRNFKEAIRYDEKGADSYLNIAFVYFDLKHDDEAAIGYLKKAIELKPDSADPYSELGLVYHHQKNDAEAIKQVLKAIETDPKYLQAYLNLAAIYKDQKNYVEALKQGNRAVQVAPDDYRPYRGLAQIYEAQHKNEDAIHYYQEAIDRLKSGDSMANSVSWAQPRFTCRIERLRGHYPEAISCFQKLDSLEPPDQTSYDLGATYVASGNKKAALVQHQQLVQLRSPLAEDLLRQINEMK